MHTLLRYLLRTTPVKFNNTYTLLKPRFTGDRYNFPYGNGNQLAPGVVAGGSLCELQNVGSGFVGTLEISNQTFVNGAGCT